MRPWKALAVYLGTIAIIAGCTSSGGGAATSAPTTAASE